MSDPAKLADTFNRELTRVATPVADDFSLSLRLSDPYRVNQVYGFALENAESAPSFSIPRVFYQERPGAFLVDLASHPGSADAADWGILDAHYLPVGSTTPVTQSVEVKLPFDPDLAVQSEFYEHAAVRKGYAVLAAGLGIEEAVAQYWTENDPTAAQTTLTDALDEFDRRVKPLGTDAP